MSSADYVHVARIPVRWSDFDRYGHIMNANYIELAQESRLQFAEDYFYSQGHEFAVFVRRVEADYFKPILSDTTEVTIETTVVEIGNTSFVTRQEIKDRQNRLACVIECVQVTVDMETETPRALTDKEIGILTAPPKLNELDAAEPKPIADQAPEPIDYEDYGDEY